MTDGSSPALVTISRSGFHRARGDLDADGSGLRSPLMPAIAAAHGSGRRRRRDDAFLDGRTGRVQGVFDAAFFSFISTSVAAPTFDHRHAASQTRSCSFSRS